MTGEAVLCSKQIRWQVPAALLLFVLLWTWSYFTLMPEPIGALKNGAVFVVEKSLKIIFACIAILDGCLFIYQFAIWSHK